MPLAPAGTVTFLYADIEGSTRLLTMLGSDYPALLAEFRRLFRVSVEGNGGQALSTEGDAGFAVFPRASPFATSAATT